MHPGWGGSTPSKGPAYCCSRSDRRIHWAGSKDAEIIKGGSTLSNEPLPDKRFDFQIDNPTCLHE